MWPERTHKIRRTPLSLKRVLHPVLFHSHLCLLFSCFCLTSCYSRSVHISIHFLSRFPKKPPLLADRLRGWHCGLPMALDRKPIRNRRSLSFSQDYVGIEERNTKCIKLTQKLGHFGASWMRTPLFVNSSEEISFSTRYIVRTKQIVFDSSMQFYSFTLH